MGKLVRDLIPQIIESDGRTPSTRVLEDEDYGRALLDKVVEEAQELRDAPARDRLEEMADVYEVLRAVAERHGHTMEDVMGKADEKRAERGGFSARIWLSSW